MCVIFDVVWVRVVYYCIPYINYFYMFGTLDTYNVPLYLVFVVKFLCVWHIFKAISIGIYVICNTILQYAC